MPMCIHYTLLLTFIPFTQYVPLKGLQLVDNMNCLISLQELALRDLALPIDGDKLQIIIFR